MPVKFYKWEDNTSGSTGNFWGMYGALSNQTNYYEGTISYASSSTSNYQYAYKMWKSVVSMVQNKGFALRSDATSYDAEIGLVVAAGIVGSNYWPDYGDSIVGIKFHLIDGIGNVLVVSMWHDSVTASTGYPPVTLPNSGKFLINVRRGLIYD